jgi:hypothetical protein
MAGSFLQTTAAQVLKRLVVSSSSIEDYDREELTAFLSNGQSYAPASGQITGILKEMQATMQKNLDDVVAEEESAKTTFDELMAAKTKEVEANTQAIESKTVRVGNLGVEIAGMKNDLSDTEEQLIEDKEFLANMDTTCV